MNGEDMKTTRKSYPQRGSSISKGFYGVGVDIERVDRFRTLNTVAERAFLERIFTREERAYCFSKKDPAPHLAARFCAKEAVTKALASLGIHHVSYDDIEIINTKNGVPKVKAPLKYNGFNLHISLTHVTDYAIAFAVVCRV